MHRSRRSLRAQAPAPTPRPSGAPHPAPEQRALLSTPSGEADCWEMDFYSIPVRGANGKRLWELVVCDEPGTFVHTETFANNQVNSQELRRALEALVSAATHRPRVIRFFRSAMRNMISIAVQGIDEVVAQPSRRTYALLRVLAHRQRHVHPQLPGYEAASAATLRTMGDVEVTPFLALAESLSHSVDFTAATRLPDELRGDRLSFASVQLSEVERFRQANFCQICPVTFPHLPLGDEVGGVDAITPDTLIPGVVVFSERALPLAARLAGVELAQLNVDLKRDQLYLECSLDTSYVFSNIRSSMRADAEAFQAAKRKAEGLHFMAVQPREDDDRVVGFWLMRDPTAVSW